MKKKLKHTHSILVRFITANNSKEKDRLRKKLPCEQRKKSKKKKAKNGKEDHFVE